MSNIALAINLTAAVFCGLLFLAYRHLRLVMHTMERHGISESGGAVPTIVMEKDAPVEVVLPGERRLYIATLTMQQADVWRKEFVLFLGRNITAVNMLPFLEASALDDPDERLRSIVRCIQIFRQHDMQASVARLLGKTILRDKRRNPGNVTARWLVRNCTELELAEILLVTYAYNNGAYIKKNYLSLLGRIAGISPGMNAMPLSSLPLTGAARTGTETPLYQGSPYAPGLSPNAPGRKSAK